MKRNLILIAGFALILALPTFDAIFNFSPVKDLFEKRLPAEKPQLPQNFSDAKNYPQNYEKFFNDNYGMRKSLIAFNSYLMDKIFDESPDARAVIGFDGWLYFDNHNSLLDTMGRLSLSDELVERGVKSFGENWKKLRAKNIDYLLIIAADKSTVYPEFLPDYIKASNGDHRIDKFLKALKKKYPDFPVLDLRPIMKKAKEKEMIYHKTDTHWNRRGAHYAYVEIIKMLSKNNPHLKPNLRDKFENRADEYVRGDISDIMGIDETELNYDLKPKFRKSFRVVDPNKEEMARFHRPVFFANRDKSLPRIFAFQDSFYGDLSEYMAEHFSRSFEINEFPCDLNYETIKNYRPDILIQQFWEGRIEVVLNQCKS